MLGYLAAFLTALSFGPWPNAQAKEAPLSLSKREDASSITARFDAGKITAFGREWDARRYCNVDTIANPDQLEAFAVEQEPAVVVTLCPRLTDGDEDVV